MDTYPTWQDKSLTPEEKVRVVGEDIVQSTQENLLSDSDLEGIKNKLTKARTQLILDRPFLGNLVLRLPLVAADSWCKTSATDAKSFYYNPEFIDSLNKHQIKFVLIHEALHCALTHFARRGNRTKHKWDLACDFAINPLLVKEGFHPPIDVPIFQQYAGMIAEEIYPMIDDNLNQEPMDQHLYDDQANDDSKQSDGGMREDQLQQEPKPQSKANEGEQGGASSLAQQPAILRPDEIEKLATQWQKNLASSAQIAQQAGKLDGEFAKLVDFFLQPQVSWQSLLAQYMSALARDDFSYSRPSRRSGEAILPALKSHQIDITVAIDTSGSISQEEVDEFVSEVNAIKANLRASITLIACDDKLSEHSPWRFEAWDALQFPASLGGGKGTNFNPVFDYINAQDRVCDVLIYFTDAKGKFPEIEPNYPVMWLVKGKEVIPWGARIQLQ
ncbi:Sll7028 protein [uncultured Gammaproteobacteria bacterium]|uniref:vWA domain-containing protein n=1 Tax=Bathymodiolus heckerae thiotrophic gill symbiont TaxID=1052212 RepID=UPI0010B75892|nr:VWA-like domain-containing protein [Bathymodiolus heckerae thiotrophic gill symbiont]CAC9455295.1 Sll7028 protein [uncultured Gammaproteobacteria bacterium]SMN13748.1 Sll7028 protein [Bathymodiolus heckerae thiotrophic gill symbiont]